MTAIAPPAGAAAVVMAPGAGRMGPAAGAPTLLPLPEQPVGSIESVYALMEQANAQNQKNGKADVETKFEARRAALEKYQAQLKKAAEEKSSGVLGTLAKIGAVAAAAAATVCTCGAAAPTLVIVGLAISGAGMVVSETKCLDFMGKGVSRWVGLGLGVVGGLMSGGASGMAAARIIGGAAAVAEGGQILDTALHERTANHYREEAKRAEHQMRRIQAAIDEVISELQDGKDASRRRGEIVDNIVQTEGATLVIAAGGRS